MHLVVQQDRYSSIAAAAMAAILPPLEVAMGDINVQNIGQLRTLNEHTFPVRYADKFYDEIPTLPEGLAKFAYCGGFAVGNCCARLEPFWSRADEKKKLYIMTIGVLHAYRRRGVGRQLLTQLLEGARKRGDVRVVYMHVQTGNDAARDFYAQFGFTEVGTIKGYYKRIQPDSCYVLAKAIEPGDDPAQQLAAEVSGLEAS